MSATAPVPRSECPMHPTGEPLTIFEVARLRPPWALGVPPPRNRYVQRCAHVGARFVVLSETDGLWFVYYVDLERRGFELGGYGFDTDPDSDGTERFAFYLERMLAGVPVRDDHAPRLLLATG